MCIWPCSAARLHTSELRHHCTLSWLFLRMLVWPSSFLLYKALLLLHFSKQQKKKHALLYYGSKFVSWSRWTVSATSRYLAFFHLKNTRIWPTYFTENREQGLLSTTRTYIENHGQWKRYKRHIANVSIIPAVIISALQIELQWSWCRFLLVTQEKSAVKNEKLEGLFR